MLMNLLGKLYLKSIVVTNGVGVLYGPDDVTTQSALDEAADELNKKIYAPLDLLIKVLCYGIAGVGAIIVIKSFVDFIAAYPQHDSTAMMGALKWFVAGVILGSIGILVPFLRSNF